MDSPYTDLNTNDVTVSTKTTRHVPNSTHLNFGYFLIGLIIGMIILIIVVVILYATRVLWFSDCKIGNDTCTIEDYYNSPEIAIQNGEDVSQNLFLANVDNTTVLKYKRIIKNSDCTPGTNQEIIIPFPQQCMLTTNGANQMIYRRTSKPDDKSVTLEYTNTNSVTTVDLGPNCMPPVSTGFTSGVPVARWDLGT